MKSPDPASPDENQEWFEFRDVRKRGFGSLVWIPLKMSHVISETGKSGYEGHRYEYAGIKTIAFPVESKASALKLGWQNSGFGNGNSGWVDEGKYVTAETFSRSYPEEVLGLNLLLIQEGDGLTGNLWHLNQDLVLTLGLWREGDSWVRPEEGYVEVARIKRGEDGRPYILEIRAEHLRDYLCARGMGLYLTSYRERTVTRESAPDFSWPEDLAQELEPTLRWEGRVVAIHEGGGMRFGEQAAVFRAVRTDVEPDEDVPVMGPPTDDNIEMSSWTREFAGRKLHRVSSDLWKDEWIDPSDASPIVRGDEVDPTSFFIVDASGKTESRRTLSDSGRWLWFRPEVIAPMAHRRGGSLKWYTRDTGSVSVIPGYEVTFGINKLGLVTVYAKDVALLPDWQQRIWAGYNVAPDGGVSEELHASQVKAVPANTLAPEAFLGEGLLLLNRASSESLGFQILLEHDAISDILQKTHRFRSCDQDGFFALAKDLARLTVDSFNHAGMKAFLALKKEDKLGTLKMLERILAGRVGTGLASTLMGPLHGIYALRHRDAHLPGSEELGVALSLVNVDNAAPHVVQAVQMLHTIVSTIHGIAVHLGRPNTEVENDAASETSQ